MHRAMIDAHQPFRDFVLHREWGLGSAVYVRTSGKPFHDANGNFLGYRGTGDRTLRRTIRADHAERALRQAQAETRARNARDDAGGDDRLDLP